MFYRFVNKIRRCKILKRFGCVVTLAHFRHRHLLNQRLGLDADFEVVDDCGVEGGVVWADDFVEMRTVCFQFGDEILDGAVCGIDLDMVEAAGLAAIWLLIGELKEGNVSEGCNDRNEEFDEGNAASGDDGLVHEGAFGFEHCANAFKFSVVAAFVANMVGVCVGGVLLRPRVEGCDVLRCSRKEFGWRHMRKCIARFEG